jgi:hypothetical protein
VIRKILALGARFSVFEIAWGAVLSFFRADCRRIRGVLMGKMGVFGWFFIGKWWFLV